MTEAASPGESLASMLEVERLAADDFTARLEDFWGGSLGCDALARAALAAGQTCADKELHSLHASFIATAPPALPIALKVERLADGDPGATRRVQLRHEGRLLCDVTPRFTSAREGLSYQGIAPAPAPAAATQPSTAERARAEGWEPFAKGPIEFRRLGAAWPWPPSASSAPSTHREWVRLRQPLPAEPQRQTAALVFLSNFYSHWTASDRLAADFRPDRFSDLGHTVWIHHRQPWDGWWMLEATSEVGHAGRMLTRRNLFTESGVLVASAVMEGLYLEEGC